jgi:predicted nucleic-acid-binding Zn-ribbon protein
MAYVFAKKLPQDMIDLVKLYTGEGHWRNGKYMNSIQKDDFRYTMLKRRPTIKQVRNDCVEREIRRNPTKGSVWFKLENNKFIVINMRCGYFWNGRDHLFGYCWEMYYNETVTTHPI